MGIFYKKSLNVTFFSPWININKSIHNSATFGIYKCLFGKEPLLTIYCYENDLRSKSETQQNVPTITVGHKCHTDSRRHCTKDYCIIFRRYRDIILSHKLFRSEKLSTLRSMWHDSPFYLSKPRQILKP